MNAPWDPATYRRYAPERDRPFHELMARVDARPRQIADLGCGDGRLTQVLHERWPDAEVVGVDASPQMLREAYTDSPMLRFQLADLGRWKPSVAPDLIVSNAALHWIPDHRSLLERIVSLLAPGGVLAVQVPYNQDAPSHRAVREVADEAGWRDALEGLGAVHVLPPEATRDHLLGLGCTVDLWTTTYHHLLSAPNGVLDWLRGTTLRPYLARLEEPDQARFLELLQERLAAYYPASGGRMPFPFRRLFFVARLEERQIGDPALRPPPG